MEATQLSRAIEELNTAKNKLYLMRNADNMNKLATLWQEFLTSTERVFNKLKNATQKESSSKGWFDRLNNTRKNDELMKYVLHARNADEHGLYEITDKRPGSINFFPSNGHSAYIDHMVVKNGQVTLGQQAAKNIIFRFNPAKVILLPVTDRGVAYHPPEQHMNNKIQGTNPLVVAELAIHYLDGVLADAQNFIQND